MSSLDKGLAGPTSLGLAVIDALLDPLVRGPMIDGLDLAALETAAISPRRFRRPSMPNNA